MFFESAQSAEAAGYRASRRARDDRHATSALRQAWVAQACRQIELSATPPTLAELAQDSGLSIFHFHRVFKAETGLTPRAYARAIRARRLHDALNTSHTTITTAAYDAGFNASSRFYAATGPTLGMRPRDYRKGGTGATIRFAVGQCSLGAILVAQSQRGLCAIWLGDDPDLLVRQLQDQYPRAELRGDDTDFETQVALVIGLVENPGLGLSLPLDIRGTVFQERVWQALCEIPAGSTASYADIAERIGHPRAVRAVARACGANLLAVAIPCHRVLRQDGNLSGYRWGVERKQELLRREHLCDTALSSEGTPSS